LHVGAVHHRVRLTPRWFVLTCAHFLLDHIDPILEASKSRGDGPEVLVTFLKSILFDASLTLDAYGMSLEEELRTDPQEAAPESSSATSQAPAPHAERPHGRHPHGQISRLPADAEGCEERCAFLDLDDTTRRHLRTLEPMFHSAMGTVLEEFYETFTQWPLTAPLLTDATVQRLLAQVSSYWFELAQSQFDRPYSVSRTRIGVIHEQLGVTAQLYLIGLARQLASFVRALFRTHAEPRPAIAALLRAAFFDISYVMDAYMDARAAAVLRTEGYASQLLACLNVGVAILDPQLRLRSANPALLKLLGTDAGLIRHLHLRDLLPDPRVVALAERARANPEHREALQTRFGGRLLRLNTMRLSISSSGVGALSPEGSTPSQLALLVDDISDLVHLAPQIDQLEQHLSETIASIDAVLWEADPQDWTFSLVSSPVLQLTGFREMHFLGRAGAWLERIPAPDRERFVGQCRALRDGERSEITHRLLHADGSVPWIRTHVVRTPRGTRPAVFHGVSLNITASFEAERRRLEAITRLSGNVAHEFNSVLTVVSGAIAMLAEEATPATLADLAAARAAVERGATLTRHLQSLAHSRPLRPRPVLLSDLVQASHTTVERTLGANIDLTTQSVADLWWCQLDPAQFEEALLNLVRNARDAMPRGGRVRIDTRNVRGDTLRPAPEIASEGDHVELALTDSGGGMPDEVRLRSVEPFFTTKDQALGLGLSVVHGFVRQSHGHLVVESRVSEGTTIRMRFPRLHRTLPPLSGDPAAPASRRSVLVVDDDATVAQVFRRLLERRGYAVSVAHSTEQARLRLAETLPDAVITDVVFGSSPLGIPFARDLRTNHPHLPVIITSGYTKDSLDLGPDDLFLPKPFTIEELETLLTRCFRAP
ncbi:MAG: response regulator, partial [Verrucomicrobiales bacterium]|nr:response regulator [Verrucomicrobiales bacterium]